MNTMVPITVNELASIVGGQVIGDGSLVLTKLASLEHAAEGALSFYGSTVFREQFERTHASCLLLRDEDAEASPCKTMIVVASPYESFVKVVTTCVQPEAMPVGVRAANAVVAPSAQVADTASIGPGCVIGDECVIGEGVQLVANVVVYPRTRIGRATIVHANVTICSDTHIGQRCIIHAGAVLGSDGFGYVENKDHSYTKIPQIGNVVLGNDVEIGANVTIDRAALGSTTIGHGVKIDNLVQVAHGVTIGDHTAIAAQSGISGGAKIGKRTRLAGQVGVAGHIEVADDVIVLGQSGVTKSITESGVYSGLPAQPHTKELRNEAALRDMLSMRQNLQHVIDVVDRLESKEEL